MPFWAVSVYVCIIFTTLKTKWIKFQIQQKKRIQSKFDSYSHNGTHTLHSDYEYRNKFLFTVQRSFRNKNKQTRTFSIYYMSSTHQCEVNLKTEPTCFCSNRQIWFMMFMVPFEIFIRSLLTLYAYLSIVRACVCVNMIVSTIIYVYAEVLYIARAVQTILMSIQAVHVCVNIEYEWENK